VARWVVSVKGVLLRDECVVLVHNERDEWELPGGQLELDETPEQCVERKIGEELFVTAKAVSLLDTWVFEVVPGTHVLIVTFGCEATLPEQLRHSDEHDDVKLVPIAELDGLNLPAGYRQSILTWAASRTAD